MSMHTARPTGRSDPRDDPAELYFRFTIGEVFYVLRDAWVHNVLPVDVEPMPEKIAKNGVLYPVVDPRSLFRLDGQVPAGVDPAEADPAGKSVEKRRLILLSAGNRLSALIVDRVFDRLRIDTRRFQSIPWHFGGREQLWFEGVACLDEHRCLVLLRPQGLLASSHPSSPGPSRPSRDVAGSHRP